MGIVPFQLPDDLKRIIGRQVAEGLAASETDYVKAAIRRYAEDLDFENELTAEAGGGHIRRPIAAHSPPGRTSTITVWPEIVTHGLLPKADIIIFQPAPPPGSSPSEQEARTSIDVPWDDAFPIVQHLLSLESDIYPQRWRYHDYPDRQTFAALKRLAVADLRSVPSV